MNKMDDNHQYHHPYYRAKHYNHHRRYDDDRKRLYKGENKSYSSSYRRPYRTDYRYQQNNSKRYSYYSTPPPPLMATPIAPPVPPPSLTVVPHERESWIRSVKKTKLNEKSTEEKTQYLETMLRLPQQKSLLNSSRFDRMRFADDQLSTSTTTNSVTTSDNLDNSSFHFIDNIRTEEDILTLEKLLFNNELEQQTSSDQKPSINESESGALNDPTSVLCSGFLINDCDEEEELPPFSPLPSLPRLSFPEENSEKSNADTNEQRVLLVSELDAAESERRQALKRQKRLHQKLRKRQSQTTKTEQQVIPSTENRHRAQEASSDWIIEYNVNQPDEVSQLTDEVRRTSVTITDEDRTTKVNLILTKIKKQQEELRKLRHYVLSMLGEQPKVRPSKINGQDSNLSQDLLFSFLNQPTNSGCWLCSGKMYAEMATQCDHVDEQ